MEVVNLMFAILGHVLASVLYITRRIMFYSSKADVDTSSILERKEEIKQLWEKKMMANNDTSETRNGIKNAVESKISLNHSEMNGNATKISNGSANHVIDEVAGNHVEEKVEKEKENAAGRSLETKLSKKKESPINSNEVQYIIDKSLEDDTTIISKGVEPETTTEGVNAEISVEKEQIESTDNSAAPENLVEGEQTDRINSETTAKEIAEGIPDKAKRDDIAESKDEDAKEIVQETPLSVESSESDNIEEEVKNEDKINQDSKPLENGVGALPELDQDSKKEEEGATSPQEASVEFKAFEFEPQVENKSIEREDLLDETNSINSFHEDSLNDDSIPGHTDENSLADEPTSETLIAESDDKDEKSFDDHFILDTRETIASLGDDEKTTDIAKKSRSVQKTEQPYSTCTTETKIAMEIREMREREEELKLIREKQIATSPTLKPQKQIAQVVKAPPKQPIINGYATFSATTKHSSTPGYRASSVFGPRGSYNPSPPKDESKTNRNFSKESAVEKEIRLAKDREEELRKLKGLPPREDDSYVKPSEVKSSQAKVFTRMSGADSSRLMATAKIQTEIEEQTLREMALRDTGHIQTLSTERTDAKVTKLSTFDISAPECTSPTFQNGSSQLFPNYGNGHISPTDSYAKRSTPSPTSSHASYGSRNVAPIQNKVSMQKFIASRGKETTFSASKTIPIKAPKVPVVEVPEINRFIPEPGKLKRTVSVESKIQQEIMEMKLREEELKHLHFGKETEVYENGNNHTEYEHDQSNGQDCPRQSNLIAQWEQRIQNAEGKA